jgi:hypothetical protein
MESQLKKYEDVLGQLKELQNKSLADSGMTAE